MARDPSTRICSMVQTLDDGDGVTVSVATHDERQAFAIVLDGDESAAFQRTLAFDRDAVVLGLRETIAGTRARAERAESAIAAECTKSAGLKAIEAAQAGIERLTRERTTAEALAARRGEALATEKLNHDQTKQKAIDLGNSNHNLRNLCEQLEKRAITAKTDRDEALAALEARPLLEPHALAVAIRERDDARAKVERLAHEVSVNRDTIAMSLEDFRAARALLERERRMREETRLDLVKAQDDRDAHSKAHDEAVKALATAEARIKALDGDAVPFEWGIFSPAPDDRMQESFVTKDEAEADLEYYPKKFFVSPLYRHPPRPAGKPVVWAIVFSDGMVNCYVTELDARQSQSFGRGRLTPLYEAPPPGCVDHGQNGVGC